MVPGSSLPSSPTVTVASFLTALCPCQVLFDLVLGASPSPQQQAELESELQSLGLEEALSEVVYQVRV